MPLVRVERLFARARGQFFTQRELLTLRALCDRVIPPDADPGAGALGAVRYVRRMLTAFDRDPPAVFACGPFSSRNPYPDNDSGRPSRRRPKNRFRGFVPLTRLQGLVWRAELFGSATVPELAALDAQYGGPKRGLRDVYLDGLAAVDVAARAMHGKPFRRLAAAAQEDLLRSLDRGGAFPPDPRRGNRTFIDLLIQHTIEACFAPPEYGGNRRRNGVPQGWRMLGLAGDVQPLGYSIFSRERDDYVERPAEPVSTPNPDELDPDGNVVPRPLTADGAEIQRNIALLTSGFADGGC
jgi:hypothetical protein